MKSMPVQFWIVLPLSKEANQSLRFERFETLDAASVVARDLAATRPTPEGYAIMECVLITAEPVVSVDLTPPDASPAQAKLDEAASANVKPIDAQLTPAAQ